MTWLKKRFLRIREKYGDGIIISFLLNEARYIYKLPPIFLVVVILASFFSSFFEVRHVLFLLIVGTFSVFSLLIEKECKLIRESFFVSKAYWLLNLSFREPIDAKKTDEEHPFTSFNTLRIVIYVALSIYVWSYSYGFLFGVLVFFILALLRPKTAFFLYFALMTLTPHQFWSNTYILIAALLFSGVFLIRYFFDKSEFDYKPVSLAFFAAFCGISLITGFGGTDSLRVFALIFSAMLISVFVGNLFKDAKDFINFARVIFLVLIALSIAAIFQFIFGGIELSTDFVDFENNPGLPGRVYATFGNPNNFAQAICLLAPLCVGWILSLENRYKRFALLFMFAPILAALALTFSRAGYLAAAVSALVFIIFLRPRALPVFIIAGIVALPLLPEPITQRLLNIGDASVSYRMYIWKGALETLAAYPVTGIGIGPNAFQMVYRAYANEAALRAMHSHNTFLNIWLEIGIGGFIAFLVYFIGAFFKIFKTIISGSNKFFATGVLASMAAFITLSMAEHLWFYPRIMLIFFLLMAVSLSFQKRR